MPRSCAFDSFSGGSQERRSGALPWRPRGYSGMEADASLEAVQTCLNPRLRRLATAELRLDWSPEQISGWLKRTYWDQEGIYVSPETIYRSLFVQSRGVLKAELTDHLRSRRFTRRSKKARVRGKGRGRIVDAVSIRDRPPHIEDRAVPGHWEAIWSRAAEGPMWPRS